MDGSRSRGARAEELCADYLRGKGYRIVARNYRCRGWEIDIIAEQNTAPAPLRLLWKKDGYLVFAEIKMRSGRGYGEAREAVDRRKQQRIRLAALTYLSEYGGSLQPRFDVIEVYASGDGFEINHIENAFE